MNTGSYSAAHVDVTFITSFSASKEDNFNINFKHAFRARHSFLYRGIFRLFYTLWYSAANSVSELKLCRAAGILNYLIYHVRAVVDSEVRVSLFKEEVCRCHNIWTQIAWTASKLITNNWSCEQSAVPRCRVCVRGSQILSQEAAELRISNWIFHYSL